MKKASIYNQHGHTPQELILAQEKYKDVCKADIKITVIVLCMCGMGVNQIARVLNIRPNTVGRYIRDYNENGLEQLLDYKKSPGKPSVLTEEERQELRRILEDKPEVHGYPGRDGWTANLVQQYIADKMNKTMGKAGVYQMLKRMGYVFSKDVGSYIYMPEAAGK